MFSLQHSLEHQAVILVYYNSMMILCIGAGAGRSNVNPLYDIAFISVIPRLLVDLSSTTWTIACPWNRVGFLLVPGLVTSVEIGVILSE